MTCLIDVFDEKVETKDIHGYFYLETLSFDFNIIF